MYPEQGGESDVVTVYRTYENGLYRYEDDYGAILMRPAYEEQVRTFAEQYLPSEGIKIYTEIKSGGSGAADGEPVLNEVSAATYIFMDDALCSGQYEAFLEAVPDWLAENCQGVPAGIYLRMTESEAWQQIDRSGYEDKLREDIYTGELRGRNIMRKILLLTVCCALVCSLSGCIVFRRGLSNEYRSDEELADEMIENIIDCAEKEDAKALTELFSQYAEDSREGTIRLLQMKHNMKSHIFIFLFTEKNRIKKGLPQ